MRAALYVRASTDLQKYSTANQTAALLAYALQHGYTVVGSFEDDGRSGLDLEGRPGLKALLQEALAPYPSFQALLVYDVSRWGRFQDADEGAHYEFLCRRAGIKVVYCAESFANDGSPMSHIMKAIRRTMAAEYSRELSEKVSRGKRRLASMGFAQAQAVYGLRRMLVDEHGKPRGVLEAGERKAVQSDRVVFVPGPAAEVAVVRRIFRLFAHLGLGYADIARFLNDRHIPGPRGGQWKGNTVSLMLTNEIYIGTLTYGRSACKLQKVRRTQPEEWIRLEGAIQSIVSRKDFQRVQWRKARMTKARTDDYYLKPLKRLLKREGYLTAGMIDAEPNMPKATAYEWRFHGLTNAYRLIGYNSPYRALAQDCRARAREPDRQTMLQKLRALLGRTGYLTRALIDSEPEMPNSRQYQWAFGDLATAYRLVDYAPQASGKFRKRKDAVASKAV